MITVLTPSYAPMPSQSTWNLSGDVTVSQLNTLTEFVVRTFRRGFFRTYIIAMTMSHCLVRPTAAHLLACCTLAFGAVGRLTYDRNIYDLKSDVLPFDVPNTKRVHELELEVLSACNGVIPTIDADYWKLFRHLYVDGIGQQLVMFMMNASLMADKSVDVPARCAEYQAGIKDPRTYVFLETLGVSFPVKT
jgi:hypothetical protein